MSLRKDDQLAVTFFIGKEFIGIQLTRAKKRRRILTETAKRVL